MVVVGFNTSLKAAMNSQQSQFRGIQRDIALTTGRLSSGNRIQRAADDVASMSIITQFASRIAALKSSRINMFQASSLLQVADGGMAEIDGILQRMSALAVMSGAGG